eukprot:2351172-Rhodomonas_salina.1
MCVCCVCVQGDHLKLIAGLCPGEKLFERCEGRVLTWGVPPGRERQQQRARVRGSDRLHAGKALKWTGRGGAGQAGQADHGTEQGFCV